MEWIDNYCRTQVKKKSSITKDIQKLSITDEPKAKLNEGFIKYTFRSTFLQQTFRSYHYTDITPEDNEKDNNKDNTEVLSQFTLLMPTQY